MSAVAGHRITLAEVPQPELERLAAFGFDGDWLMGVWERSARARAIASSMTDLLAEYQRALPDLTAEDVVGSPYALRLSRATFRKMVQNLWWLPATTWSAIRLAAGVAQPVRAARTDPMLALRSE